MASVGTEQIQKIFNLNILLSVKHILVQILCQIASIMMKQYSNGIKSIISWLKKVFIDGFVGLHEGTLFAKTKL